MVINFTSTSASTANTVAPLDRVRMLSAFEGNNAYDKDGNPLFKDIRVTTADETAIKAYFRIAAAYIETALASMLTAEATVTDSSMTITLKESYAARGQHSLPDAIAEALAMYALYRWLADKASDRASEYERTWQQALETVRRIAFQKARPTYPTV